MQLKESCRNNKKFLFVILIIVLMIVVLYGFSKAFNVCITPYIKTEDEKGCCPDFDKDGECDGDKEIGEDLNECVIMAGDRKFVIGKICDSVEDCIKTAKRMGDSEFFLDPNLFSCERTSFQTLPDLVECKTKEDCLDSIENKTDLHEVIRCGGNGFCQMTEYSMLGLKDFYSIRK